jgi:archaellum component FlaC
MIKKEKTSQEKEKEKPEVSVGAVQLGNSTTIENISIAPDHFNGPMDPNIASYLGITTVLLGNFQSSSLPEIKEYINQLEQTITNLTSELNDLKSSQSTNILKKKIEHQDKIIK